MLNRRDVWLGLSVLVVVAGVVVIALLSVLSLASGDLAGGRKRVAVVDIIGPIMSSTAPVQQLERYIENENVPVIVIRLNTPGGGVAASQEIYETVRKARRAGKTVIASMGAVAASGGYYIAAACDTILANPGTITGSIGVIASFADFSELYKKIGIDFSARKSGKYKDMGSTSRKMTDEEKALLDSVIMDTYDQFVQAVSEGRNIDLDSVRALADGRIFTGRQALGNGLVDILGTYHDALDIAGEISGLGKNPPVLKERRDIWEDFILREAAKLLWFRVELGIPKLLYVSY